MNSYKLEVIQRVPSIDIFSLELPEQPSPEVYLNDQRLPPGLERIVLAGLNYLSAIEGKSIAQLIEGAKP